MFRTDTPLGRFLNDLAYTDLSDKHLARKHGKPIAEVRETRRAVKLGQRIGAAINGHKPYITRMGDPLPKTGF